MVAHSKKSKTYPLEQCALYKLRNKRRLAALLNISPDRLHRLLILGDRNYHQFEIRPQGRKPRQVEQPKKHLERVHTRVFTLLKRVTPPPYLHSGIKGKSYVTNARSHLGDHPVGQLDIMSFYPSTTHQHVYKFFRKSLLCAPDIARILTRLTTVSGHVPTGSCISQLLAFYAHKEMFDEIYALASQAGITMTCYVDDLTFSGTSVTPRFIWEAKKRIHQQGLRYHKVRLYQAKDPKRITGVIIRGNEAKVPNKLQQSIHLGLNELSNQDLDQLRSLAGKCNAAAQIETRFQSAARRVRKEPENRD